MPLEFDVIETEVATASDAATAVVDRPEDMVNGPDEGSDSTAASEHSDEASPEPDEQELTPEQKQAAEDKHQANIEAATEEHKSLAVQRSEAEAELKELKASEKAALKRIIWLTQSGPQYPKPAKAKPANDDGTEGDINEDASWREINTSTLVDGIRGMGVKKAELVVDLAPTLGHLEDLRAEASSEHEPFHTKLPKGVGSDMADELEDRMLKVIGDHCN
jgi:hypothetical protein